MLKKILIGAAAAVAIALVAATLRPDTYRIERSASIAAPAAKVHGYINDMRTLNTWNPST